MKCNKLLSLLTKTLGYEPKQAEIAKITNLTNATMSARVKRNGDFSEEEVSMLEESYGISLVVGSDCVEIEHIHINPSCGRGTAVLDEADVTPVKIGKEVIKNLWGVPAPEVLKLFKASGDSMESDIEDGNILLVDTSRTDYHNGGIYVLTINNDWFVKRLRLRITGELDIISDNTKYPMETLTPDTNVEIKVIGRVIKNLSRGL